jgi:YVTN family beta-propeller protein
MKGVSESYAGAGRYRAVLGVFAFAALVFVLAAPLALAQDAYVANSGSESVSVIDTASGEVVGGPINVGSVPGGVAITPDGKRAYVANYLSDSVSVIDTASEEVVGEPIAVGSEPRAVAITPDGEHAYVADEGSDSVSVIDTASEEVVGEPIAVGSEPLGIAITPDQAPLASLAPGVGIAGQPVQLDASASRDPDGQIARYDWNFGDGQTAADAGATPTHTYSAPGTYRVAVTLTDSESCSTSFVFTGLTAYCNGSSLASATSTVQVAAAPLGKPAPGRPGPPSNAFRIGKLRRDTRRGIVKLEVRVPDPGTLLLRGKRVRNVRRVVDGAGTVNLVVRSTREEMKALKHHGRLRVRARITFRPDGGAPRTRTKKLTLVRNSGRPAPRSRRR